MFGEEELHLLLLLVAWICICVEYLQVADSLHLPAEDALGEVDGEQAVVGRRVGGEADALQRADEVVDERVAYEVVDAMVLDNDVEHVRELEERVALLDQYLLGPRGEREVAVLDARGKEGREYVERLSHDHLGLGRARLEQRVKDLEDDALVDGELGYDVAEEQVAVVLVERVDARLGEQARPRERHEAAQLGALLLVVHVVDVRVRVLDEERAQL